MNLRIGLASALSLLSLLPLPAAAADIQVVIDGKVVIFTDVPTSMWFVSYVRDAAEAGIVNGYKDKFGNFTGKYGPGNSITVAEALKIAVEGAGYDEETYAMKISSGVNHWASAYVSVAKGEGFDVIADRFRLDRPATRAEVAALFTSAFHVNMESITVGTRYTDVTASTKFADSIEALSSAEIVMGDTDIHGQATGTFRPTQSINRAEVAKMIMLARAEYGTPGVGRLPEEEDGGTQTDRNLVAYAEEGFSPTVLRVKVGTTVRFRNDTTADLRVASDPHPTHDNLSAFDSVSLLSQGESYSFTFTRLGTFGYHNHQQASHKGTIIVEE